MKTITIPIVNKVAQSPADFIVCDNTDYKIKFTFDDESWNVPANKTARFKWGNNTQDVIFSGNEVNGIQITDAIAVEVGVYAGNIMTTTPAYINCKRSILSGGGTPAAPTPSVYTQILARLNEIEAACKNYEIATSDALIASDTGNNLRSSFNSGHRLIYNNKPILFYFENAQTISFYFFERDLNGEKLKMVNISKTTTSVYGVSIANKNLTAGATVGLTAATEE